MEPQTPDTSDLPTPPWDLWIESHPKTSKSRMQETRPCTRHVLLFPCWEAPAEATESQADSHGLDPPTRHTRGFHIHGLLRCQQDRPRNFMTQRLTAGLPPFRWWEPGCPDPPLRTSVTLAEKAGHARLFTDSLTPSYLTGHSTNSVFCLPGKSNGKSYY